MLWLLASLSLASEHWSECSSALTLTCLTYLKVLVILMLFTSHCSLNKIIFYHSFALYLPIVSVVHFVSAPSSTTESSISIVVSHIICLFNLNLLVVKSSMLSVSDVLCL